MNKAIIIIPIYKATPDAYELISFRQCLKVLHRYKVCIVTFDSLDTSFYKDELQQSDVNYQFEYFDKSYFENLDGYNRLMLSIEFYKRFNTFEYMLIYQLDAYVFRDELDAWCTKGYDYIGAPWFDDNKSIEEGAKLWAVGNGGFSLRKTNTFLRILNFKKNVYSYKYITKQWISGKISFFLNIKMLLGFVENKIIYLISKWEDAEDLFYCLKLRDTKLKIKVPTVEEASFFAFEQSCEYLYKQNKQQLPFGCHAWQKYDYKTFWYKHIKMQ
ncbi:MAG: hypothetical protein AUK44_01235 [Porphyromonadaceae bacterium CG2_30_38_12]|nr:MAG: hypothetical protein AUK44_01235 [Porphyromonadaceae bacterium CG2_30_38_12]